MVSGDVGKSSRCERLPRLRFQVASRLSARGGAPVPLIPVRATWLRLGSRDSRPVRALRCVGWVTRLTRESSGRAPRRLLAVCYSGDRGAGVRGGDLDTAPNPTSSASSPLLYGLACAR